MGGEIGQAVFRIGEKTLSNVFKSGEKATVAMDKQLGGRLGQQYVAEKSASYRSMGDTAKQVWGKLFGLESQLPAQGMAGPMIKRSLADYARTTDANIAKIAADNKQIGRVMNQGELHNAATKGHKLSTGTFLRGSRDEVYGDKDQILTGMLHLIEKEHGEEKAKNIADAMGVHFHEESKRVGGSSGLNGTRLVKNLAKDPLTEQVKWRESQYKERSELEKKVTSYMSATLAYKAGIAHLSTPLNMLVGTSLSSFGKATQHAFGNGYKDAVAQLQFYGALGELSAMESDQLYKFEHGLIHKFQPGTVGQIIHENFQIPFFSMARKRAMVMAGMQGKYIAEEQAANLMSGNKGLVDRAMLELKYLGIDGRDVAARGGQLSHEEIRNAIYENANQRVFIDSGRNRSQFATSSAMGRLTGMYHNYAAQQGNFMLREFRRNLIERKDPMQLVKDLAILGTVFPAVGSGIYGLEKLWMGKKPADVKAEFLKENDPRELAARAEAFAHTAGFGIMASYARSLGRAKLAQAMLGPIGSAGVELVQDSYKAGSGFIEGKDVGKGPGKVKTWEPLARDVLHDIPSLGVGAIAAEHLYPTQKTLNERQPLTSKKISARQAAQRKKLRDKILKGR